MSSVSREELRQIRIDVAIQICIRYPSLYPKIIHRTGYYCKDNEWKARHILHCLIEEEPCIKHILDFYYKRM